MSSSSKSHISKDIDSFLKKRIEKLDEPYSPNHKTDSVIDIHLEEGTVGYTHRLHRENRHPILLIPLLVIILPIIMLYYFDLRSEFLFIVMIAIFFVIACITFIFTIPHIVKEYMFD